MHKNSNPEVVNCEEWQLLVERDSFAIESNQKVLVNPELDEECKETDEIKDWHAA